MKYLFLWLIPALAECLVVCIMFATYYSYAPLAIVVFYSVWLYIVWTIIITLQRKKFRKAVVKSDNEVRVISEKKRKRSKMLPRNYLWVCEFVYCLYFSMLILILFLFFNWFVVTVARSCDRFLDEFRNSEILYGRRVSMHIFLIKS